ncbi:MAG: hypothetical protein LBQ50_05365 [Planctomycetaceae bacterium]|jgi:hypothetical protein|nr:hypothetical protein [Planctomycetaceae bacterium]
MENSNSISVTSSTEPVQKRPWWKFGTMGWILIFGLIILNIGVFSETLELNKRTINKIFYLIDPRYWSLLPVPILWGVVCWFVTDLVCRFDFIRRKRGWIRFVIVLGILCWLVWLSGWTGIRFRRQIYYGIYMTYIVGPIANYMITGIWDWKMLIAPVMAIVTIISLLYFAIKNRRPKR